MLANQGALDPFFDQPLARPRDRVDTGLQRRRDLAVAPALTTVRGVGFQQDPGLQQLLCWMVSAMDKGGEMLSLLIAQCHYVFLYRDLFPGHQSAPSAATEPSNQTNTAESMTGATSPMADYQIPPPRTLYPGHRGSVWAVGRQQGSRLRRNPERYAFEAQYAAVVTWKCQTESAVHFYWLGGGCAASSARSSSGVSVSESATAFSFTCSAEPDSGIAMTLPLRMVQASATAAAEQPCAPPIRASVGSRS